MSCGWGSGFEESAIDILNKRYANGENDQKEYEKRKVIMDQTKRNFSIEVEEKMIVDEVPEAERKDLAQKVADNILSKLHDGKSNDSVSQPC